MTSTEISTDMHLTPATSATRGALGGHPDYFSNAAPQSTVSSDIGNRLLRQVFGNIWRGTA